MTLQYQDDLLDLQKSSNESNFIILLAHVFQ